MENVNKYCLFEPDGDESCGEVSRVDLCEISDLNAADVK